MTNTNAGYRGVRSGIIADDDQFQTFLVGIPPDKTSTQKYKSMMGIHDKVMSRLLKLDDFHARSNATLLAKAASAIEDDTDTYKAENDYLLRCLERLRIEIGRLQDMQAQLSR